MSATTTVPAVEARTVSKWAGKCKRCYQGIAVGAPICKVGGQWVCEPCAGIPPASVIDAQPQAPPQAQATPPVPSVPDPHAVAAPPPEAAGRAGESIEEMHARIWRFCVMQAASIPNADERERRISALAFYKACMFAESTRR